MMHPAFGIDSQGGYHLAWVRDSSPRALIYLYSADQGATWSAPTELAVEGVDRYTTLWFFHGPNGEMHLLIKEPLDYYTLRWEDGNWSKAFTLPADLLSDGFAFIADSNRQVSLLILGYLSGKVGIWAFRDEGQSAGWSQPILLQKMEDVNELGLSATMGPNNKLYLAYAQSKVSNAYGDIEFLATTLPW
jgi:hypothetical protein